MDADRRQNREHPDISPRDMGLAIGNRVGALKRRFDGGITWMSS
jgi:hypothetical protein